MSFTHRPTVRRTSWLSWRESLIPSAAAAARASSLRGLTAPNAASLEEPDERLERHREHDRNDELHEDRADGNRERTEGERAVETARGAYRKAGG